MLRQRPLAGPGLNISLNASLTSSAPAQHISLRSDWSASRVCSQLREHLIWCLHVEALRASGFWTATVSQG